jgi:hypothetical protein
MPEHAADEPLGLESRYTVGFRRLAVYAGVEKSFEKAADTLQELCGLHVSRMTLRKLCNEKAPKMKEWQEHSSEVAQEFKSAPGVVEVTVDGTCVNTMTGGKDIRASLVSKRRLGESASPDQGERSQEKGVRREEKIELLFPVSCLLIIGSGQVEGACKNRRGRRLKQTGARWWVLNVNRMAVLCAVRYCGQWQQYWANAR